MTPALLFLFVFCTVQVIGVWSWTVPDLSGLTQKELLQKVKDLGIEERLTELEATGLTLEQIVKLWILHKEETTYEHEYLIKLCAVLVSNFTLGEGEPTRHKNFMILDTLSLRRSSINDSEKAQFSKNILCDYATHPTENVKHAEALGLAMLTYFKFEHIRKRNNNNESVVAARELCGVFWSEDNLANLKLNSNPIELSETQLGEFKKLWKQVEHIDWDKSPRLVVENLCNLLNEKISAEEQADALGITINVYSSVLNGTKELSKNNSIENHGDIFHRICRDIYMSLGFSGLFVSHNGTLTKEEIEAFTWYTLNKQPENKWKIIKVMCVQLNETVSVKYIVENVGLSDEELAQQNGFTSGSQFLQTVNLCNVLKSDTVRETSTSDLVMDFRTDELIRLEEFVFKASKILLSPMNDRLELLKDACLTTFPELYTLKNRDGTLDSLK